MGEKAYHGFVGEFLNKVAPLTEASKPCILAHLLASISSRIGSRLYVWGGDKQPCRFNVGIVGPTSSGRKGTGFVPVKELMAKADPTFWENQPACGLSSGEGLIAKLATSNEKRLLVVETEFSKVLSQGKREGNILSQIVREAYDTGDFAVLTKIPVSAKGGHVCIIGHITGEELLKKLNQVEMANGFANRFMWFSVAMSQYLPNAKPVPEAEMNNFAETLGNVFKHCDGLTEPQIEMNEETQERWKEEYPKLMEDKSGIYGELTARGSSHVLRLSLLYALLEKKDKIELVHLEAALAVWAYCDESVKSLFLGTKSDSLEDKLYNLLVSKGTMTTKDFYSHISSKGVDLNEALQKLERNGLVQSEKIETGKPGRPTIKWSLAEDDIPSEDDIEAAIN